MKTLTSPLFVSLCVVSLVGCASDGNMSTDTLNANQQTKKEEFEKPSVGLYALDYQSINNLLTDKFALAPLSAAEITAAENIQGVPDAQLTKSRQILYRYRTSFVEGNYNVVNHMRLIETFGRACDETMVAEFRSGDIQSIADKMLSERLDSGALDIIQNRVNTLPEGLRAHALCTAISASPEAYGVIR